MQVFLSLILVSSLASIPTSYPVDGWIASDYGYRSSPFNPKKIEFHPGLDIAAPIGTPIYATASGIVTFVGNEIGYGKLIEIAHKHGIVTRYGHNAKQFVKVGQRVHKGDRIGTVGNSGKVTGAHCHYEIIVNGKYVNPQKFILQ